MLRIAAVVLFALSSTACLRSTTVLTIKPDGSGTIVQETGMNAAAMGMIKSLGASSGQTQGPPPDIFGEEQARKTAEAMGATFVSGEPIKTAEMEGYRARFSFADVRKLKMRMAGDPTGQAAAASEPPVGFEFEQRGGSSVLTIALPEESLKSGPLGQMGPTLPGGADQMSPEQTAQMMQMMKGMMQGLFVDVALDVEGRILKTNANHVAGNRVTLLQLDFDQLLADGTSLQKLQGATDLKALSGVPGLKIVDGGKITIEFAR
jgi:hypothetical protein